MITVQDLTAIFDTIGKSEIWYNEWMDGPRDIQSFHFVSKTKLKKYCPSHWFCAIGWLYPQFFFSLKPSRIDENLHVYFHQIGIFGSLGKKI